MIQGIKKLMIENTGESIRNQFTKEMRAVDSWLKPITVQESFKTFFGIFWGYRVPSLVF